MKRLHVLLLLLLLMLLLLLLLLLPLPLLLLLLLLLLLATAAVSDAFKVWTLPGPTRCETPQCASCCDLAISLLHDVPPVLAMCS